jgi:hypothetical protein
VRPKRIAFAFRAALCNRSRDRPRYMLHVSSGVSSRAIAVRLRWVEVHRYAPGSKVIPKPISQRRIVHIADD